MQSIKCECTKNDEREKREIRGVPQWAETPKTWPKSKKIMYVF
jgi:hypothetical protein